MLIRIRLTRVYAAVVMLALLPLFACTAAVGSVHALGTPPGHIGIQLLEAPVSRKNDPRARMYIVDFLRPGSVIRRRLEVSNTSNEQQHVALYAAAASITDDSFTVAPEQTANELTGWVSLDHSVSDLPAGQSTDVEATITVPKEASSGERYAVIWAQVSSPPEPTGAVRMVNRVGLRIYLDVGPGGEPPSDFDIASVAAARAADGTPQVLARVRNTGGRALDMSGSLMLINGPGSLSAGPYRASLGLTLGVGGSGQITVPLDKRLPDGPWTAQLTLASGVVQHTVEARLTFPERAGVSAPVKPAAAGSGSYLVLVLVLGAIVAVFLLAALGGSLWLLTRRRGNTERLDGE
jgi:hypothetical protein